MKLKLITSPWDDAFIEFLKQIDQEALIVSPYITKEALQLLTTVGNKHHSKKFRIFTDINADSLMYGSLDVEAIEIFSKNFPDTVVKHLPELHAKVYIADQHTAIVTSGNLTHSSLSSNLEYGVQITDEKQVGLIKKNLLDYENKWGVHLSKEDLIELSKVSKQFKELKKSNDTTYNQPEIMALKKQITQKLNNEADRQAKQKGGSKYQWRIENGSWHLEHIGAQMVLNVVGALLDSDSNNFKKLSGKELTTNVHRASLYPPGSKKNSTKFLAVPRHDDYVVYPYASGTSAYAKRCMKYGERCEIGVEVKLLSQSKFFHT